MSAERLVASRDYERVVIGYELASYHCPNCSSRTTVMFREVRSESGRVERETLCSSCGLTLAVTVTPDEAA